MADKWSAMLTELEGYRKQFGTTDVSSRHPSYARLGRWIAAQRHKRRKGVLSKVRLRKLNAIGMVWSPGDTVWQDMFSQLKAYARREGHCNIPEHYAGNQKLASWAHNQRYRKRRGDLSRERKRLLDSIGFLWSIYREKKSATKVLSAPVARPAPVQDAAHVAPPAARQEERLYRLRQGNCVQYNGQGTMPETLVRYEKANSELPPYIPLPRGATTFYVGEDGESRPFKWKGTGPLPPAVLEYVNENGCLPRHT